MLKKEQNGKEGISADSCRHYQRLCRRTQNRHRFGEIFSVPSFSPNDAYVHSIRRFLLLRFFFHSTFILLTRLRLTFSPQAFTEDLLYVFFPLLFFCSSSFHLLYYYAFIRYRPCQSITAFVRVLDCDGLTGTYREAMF